MLEIGTITSKKAGVFIFGYNPRVRANLCGTGMKVTGKMELGRALVYSIMLMDLDIKVIGKIT